MALKLCSRLIYEEAMKNQNKFNLMLFGLSQININSIIEEFNPTFSIEPTNIKEVTTT